MFYHLHNPVEFTTNVASIMDESTIWCIQMSYAASMIENCVVDNIVHEHVTYYTFQSLSHLMDICNLEIFDAEVIDVYGGSIRAFIKKKSTSGEKTPITKCQEYYRNEGRRNMNEESSLIEFNEKLTILEKLFLPVDTWTIKAKASMDLGRAQKGTCCFNS